MAVLPSSKQEQLLNKAQLKQWYNHTFYHIETGQLREATSVGITVYSAQGTIVLPIMEILPNRTIASIFQELATKLEKEGPIYYQIPETEEEPRPSVDPPPVNFEQIIYRKKAYIVEHYITEGKDEFIVKRVEDRKIIDATKKTRGHVLEAYKKLYPIRF